MSFSDISREVRDLIYHALLCPSDGIGIHLSEKYRMRKLRSVQTSYDSYTDSWDYREEEEEEGEEGDGDATSDRWGNSNSDASAVAPVPTAIFSVSRQIRQEAIEVFYGCNRFTFDNSADITLRFLKCLRPSSRRRIKHIGFAGWSTCGDEAAFADWWHILCKFICRRMSLHTVTFLVPRDSVYGIDKTKEARRAPHDDWFMWSAVERMTGLLMAGNIERLRLGYSATLGIHFRDEYDRYLHGASHNDLTPKAPQHENPLEKLKSVNRLRCPQYQERSLMAEAEAPKKGLAEGTPEKNVSLDILQADRQDGQQKRDFAVTYEEDSYGDVGSVLVLTRPKAS